MEDSEHLTRRGLIAGSLAASMLPLMTGLASTLGSVTREPVLDLAANLELYGAAGDGVTDDLQPLRQALSDAQSTGRAITLGGRSFALSDTLVLSSGAVFLGPGQLRQITPGKGVFYGDDLVDVRIQDLSLIGPGSAHLIERDATNGAITLTRGSDISLSKIKISGFHTGASLWSGSRKSVTGCEINDFYLYGLVLSKVVDFIAIGNIIHSCAQRGAANAYGITATGDSANGEIQSGSQIRDNIIYGIPSWDAVMLHDVDGLICTGNIIRDVRVGFDISAASNRNKLSNITISNNYIELTHTNTWGDIKAQHAGIYVGGVDGSIVENVKIDGNIIANSNRIPLGGSGRYAGNVPAAIQVQFTNNLSITRNNITNVGNSADYSSISIYGKCENIEIENNRMDGSATKGYAIRLQQPEAHRSSQIRISGNANRTRAVADTLFQGGRWDAVTLGAEDANPMVIGALIEPVRLGKQP